MSKLQPKTTGVAVDREQAIEIIVNATRWLTSARETHMGFPDAQGHVVAEEATTSDFVPGVRGIYFGREVIFDSSRKRRSATMIMLTNYSDPDSAADYVPCTAHITHDNFRLGIHDREQVDVDRLSTYPDVQLSRMADNIMRVMYSYYGRQDILNIVQAGAPR